MKEFIRSEAYMTNIFLDSFDRDVRTDVIVTFHWRGNKLKAYCEATGTYLQFPTRLRSRTAKYICDVVKAKRDSGQIFYRAYPKSIRDINTGEVVA